MKTIRTVSFPLLLSLILSLAFVTCKKDDKDTPSASTPASTTSTVFSIENAIYHEKGNLPEGSTPLINDLTINSTVINGGSSIVSFTSPQKIKTAFVTVKGMDGYYQYDFNDEGGSLRSATSLYYYELVLLISQQLKEEGFVISISCIAENGDCSASVNTEKIKLVEVGTGTLQVSLSWDQFDDVDLHLLEPNGNEIFYANRTFMQSPDEMEKSLFEFGCYLVKKYTSHNVSSLVYTNDDDWFILNKYMEDLPFTTYSTTYSMEYMDFITERQLGSNMGYLDLDSNPGCFLDKVNNENITYGKEPVEGLYYVAVNLYKKCDLSKQGAKYSVTVNYKGQPITISDKQAGQFDADDQGNYDNSSQYHVIGAFYIDASGIRPVAVTDNPFKTFGYWEDLRSTQTNAKAEFFKKLKKR